MALDALLLELTLFDTLAFYLCIQVHINKKWICKFFVTLRINLDVSSVGCRFALPLCVNLKRLSEYEKLFLVP